MRVFPHLKWPVQLNRTTTPHRRWHFAVVYAYLLVAVPALSRGVAVPPAGTLPSSASDPPASVQVPEHYSVSLSLQAGRMRERIVERLRTVGTAHRLLFTLAPSLHFELIRIGDSTYGAVPLGDGRYRLTLAQPWMPASEHELEFIVSGSPPVPDTFTGSAIELLPSTAWYPRFKESAPFTCDVTVHLPPGLAMVTRGHETAIDSSGRNRWSDAEPGSSLGVFALPRFGVAERQQGALDLQVFSPLDFVDPPQRILQSAADDYTKMAGFLGATGGLHQITIVLLPGLSQPSGDASLLVLPLAAAGGDLDQTTAGFQLALAVARMWWPLAPSAAPSDDWLQSGLATICALHLIAERDGSDSAVTWLAHLQDWARSRNAALISGRLDPPPIHSGDAGATGVSQDAWLDAKAAMVLNALRLEIGEPFWTLVRDFFQRTLRYPQQATAATFEAMLNEAHGDYSWFWRQWLVRPDLPRIRFRWRYQVLRVSGSTVTVQVRQTGRPFGFRAPIVIVAGRRRYVRYIEVHDNDTILGIPVRGEVDSVQFDPDEELLRASAGAS
jgi:hypothetical protein